MKKIAERVAFDRTYGPECSWAVNPTESPDFLCERSGRVVLGVEVTQLWQHETDARLKNMSGYTDSLLDGGNFRHKDDPAHVSVERLQIFSAGSNTPYAEVEGLIRTLPTPAQRTAMLSAKIAQKAAKMGTYLSRCPVVDVIVEDASTLFWPMDLESLVQAISAGSERSSLLAAPFREIYLLTRYGKGGIAGCIPLQICSARICSSLQTSYTRILLFRFMSRPRLGTSFIPPCISSDMTLPSARKMEKSASSWVPTRFIGRRVSK